MVVASSTFKKLSKLIFYNFSYRHSMLEALDANRFSKRRQSFEKKTVKAWIIDLVLISKGFYVYSTGFYKKCDPDGVV